MAIKPLPAVQHIVGFNKFTAYTVCSNSTEEIQEMYSYIRLNHADARHIVCVWSICGTEKYTDEDYCEDEETGVGAPLLKILKDNNIKSRAVFIVRKCGEKLNDKRVYHYVQVLKEIVKKHAENIISGQTDAILDPTQPQTYAGAVKSPPPNKENGYRGRGQRRNRGRGRGRGQGGGRGGHFTKNDQPREDYTPRVYVPKLYKDDNTEEKMQTNDVD